MYMHRFPAEIVTNRNTFWSFFFLLWIFCNIVHLLLEVRLNVSKSQRLVEVRHLCGGLSLSLFAYWLCYNVLPLRERALTGPDAGGPRALRHFSPG